MIIGDQFTFVWRWRDVAARLSTEPAGSKVRIEKASVEHPKDGGLRPSFGLPVGQQSDFRLTLPDCRGLHVQDFGTHYEAHIDQTDPACDAILHLVQDAPGTFVVGSALVGGLMGLLLGRTSEAFAAGLLLGAGAGCLSAAAAQSDGKGAVAFGG
jgi:hypothetical protein